MLRLPQWRSGWGSPCRCGRCCQHRGPEIAIWDMNSRGFDEGAHERTHQQMRATHTSDLHKCPHSPGMPPRDLRERQARTSLEGWSWRWFKELRYFLKFLLNHIETKCWRLWGETECKKKTRTWNKKFLTWTWLGGIDRGGCSPSAQGPPSHLSPEKQNWEKKNCERNFCLLKLTFAGAVAKGSYYGAHLQRSSFE